MEVHLKLKKHLCGSLLNGKQADVGCKNDFYKFLCVNLIQVYTFYLI